jgi:hypothetical protein
LKYKRLHLSVAVFTPWVVEEVDKTMAQHQRQEDERWESPLRKVARNSARRREYLQLLEERRQQSLPRPQTGPLPAISSTNYGDFYDFVDALDQQLQLRLKQEAREHANHMNVERERIQKHIANILSSIDPSTSFQQRDTGEISLSGIASRQMVPMPAVSLERSRETKAPRMIEEIAPFLDHAVRLFVWQYNVPPTHIRLSSYNYRQLALEYHNQILAAYTNQRGTFHLLPDYQLDDATIVCEEHVMQQ